MLQSQRFKTLCLHNTVINIIIIVVVETLGSVRFNVFNDQL